MSFYEDGSRPPRRWDGEDGKRPRRFDDLNNDDKRKAFLADDLPSRIKKASKGKDFYKACVQNVFDRIIIMSNNCHFDRSNLRPFPEAVGECLPALISKKLLDRDITTLLPVQRWTNLLMSNAHDYDVFVEASTGNGKTYGFLIPVVIDLLQQVGTRVNNRKMRPYAIIVGNTQMLQLQTYEVAKHLCLDLDVKVVEAVGQTSVREMYKKLENGVDIIIATVGRLKEISSKLHLDQLRYFIYDEADKMAGAGSAFREEMVKIRELIPPETKKWMKSAFFTATMDSVSEYEGLCRQDKMLKVMVPANPLIEHRLIPLNDFSYRNRMRILERILDTDLAEQGRKRFDNDHRCYESKVIVFVNRKGACYMMGDYLAARGFSLEVINSDRDLRGREEALGVFKEGRVHLIIATDSLARGHDIEGVRLVILFDSMDNEIATFKHRAGRTARLGNSGVCITFIDRFKFGCPEGAPHYGSQPFVKDFLWYLVMECGQRIPRCLVPAALDAIVERQSEYSAFGPPFLTIEEANEMLREHESPQIRESAIDCSQDSEINFEHNAQFMPDRRTDSTVESGSEMSDYPIHADETTTYNFAAPDPEWAIPAPPLDDEGNEYGGERWAGEEEESDSDDYQPGYRPVYDDEGDDVEGDTIETPTHHLHHTFQRLGIRDESEDGQYSSIFVKGLPLVHRGQKQPDEHSDDE